MQVDPCRGVGRVVGRLRGLRKAGHDTERHLGSAALAIQNSLIHRKADALRQHFDNPAGQVDVVVIQQGIAYRHIARNLVAVQRDLVEHEVQLIDCAAHLSPHGFRYSTGDGLTRLTVDIADANAVQQLGIPEHILGNQLEENNRNRQLSAGDCTALTAHAAQLSEELLGVLLRDNGIALLNRQGIESPAGHGQRADIDIKGHLSYFLSRFGLSLDRLLDDLVKLTLHVSDFALEGLLCILVGGLVSVERFHHFFNCGLFLIGVRLVDRGGQFGFSGLKVCVLCTQFLEFLSLAFKLFVQHECSKSHFLFHSFNFLRMDSRHASVLRFWISS